jgi:hypothetical protein
VADPAADVSPYYNPALAPSASSQRLAASAALLSFDRELQFLEFTTPLGPTAGLGVDLIHAGVNNIDRRNTDGLRTGTISTDEFALSLSFGNQFTERFAAGVRLSLYQSDVSPNVEPARGFGVGVGATLRVTDQLRVAGVVSDLLAKYEWNTSSVGGRSHTDRFPVRVRLGASYTLQDGRLRLLGEVESRYTARDRQTRRVIPTSGGPRTRTGTESYLFHDLRGRIGAAYQLVDILTARAGLDRLGVDGLSGARPSAGFGVRQEVGSLDLRISYAVALEPYERTLMHLGTLELYL